MSVYRKDALLIDNTPPSIAYDPKTQSIAYAWDRQAWEVIDAIDEVVILPNLDKIVNSTLIDLLAWQLHVDFYDASAPLEARRELVKKSLEWHTFKGTKWVVEDMLRTVFASGKLVEWFEYNPKPHADWHEAYRFKVITDAGSADPTILRRLIAAINSVKPASRWLEEFLISKPTKLELWEASITVRRKTTTVYLMDRPSEASEEIFVGVALCHYITLTIYAPPWEGLN